MFANSFALAAVFSFFTNLFEVKIKMNNLLYYCRRPTAEVTNGIGEWEKVIQILAFISIPTNFASIYFCGGGGYG